MSRSRQRKPRSANKPVDRRHKRAERFSIIGFAVFGALVLFVGIAIAACPPQ
jgi:hypothetical protein